MTKPSAVTKGGLNDGNRLIIELLLNLKKM